MDQEIKAHLTKLEQLLAKAASELIEQNNPLMCAYLLAKMQAILEIIKQKNDDV